MRIGFDISQTGRSKAGCGYFADSLIRSLAQIDTGNEYVLYPTFGTTFWDPEWSATVQLNQPNIRRGLGHRSFEEMQRFWASPPPDFELKLDGPDIIHANNYFCPVGVRTARVVYTLYDLGFIEMSEFATEANRIACFDGVYRASLYADHIVAISEYSRQHFLRTFPHYPANRLTVVYPASRFTRTASLPKPHQLAQLQPDQFYLSVGTLEPRKNHQRLLNAYARLKAYQGTAFPLVLAGGKGWLMNDFEQTIDRLGIRQDVILLGYVDDVVLPWLYRNCFAFVYPSLFEGFGLPALEAMSLGSVVIASNVTSLPEIVGEAGILINPLQEDEICTAMISLTEMGANRDNLKQQALARAASFSWENTARQVATIYQAVTAQEPLPPASARELPTALDRYCATKETDSSKDRLIPREEQPMFTRPSHDNLPDVFMRELRQMQDYHPAERVDSAQAQALDIFFAYRLLLGRYPEFDDPALYRTRASGQDLQTLVKSFLESAEFQVRMPRPPEFDQVVMSELPDGLRLFYNLRDRQAMRIVTGIHELEIQRAMRLILRPGMNCIDAGAHIGLYALLMASVVGKDNGKVYAFEPFPDTYNLLTKNIKENHFDSVILPFQRACHYESGHGRIFTPVGDDLGPAFVPKRQDAPVTAGLEGVKIELARVDDLVPAQARIGLIKMDIEGSEPFALRGMTRIVTRDRPIIFTEFNPYCLRHMNESDPAEYLTQLRTYGYKLFEVVDFLQQTKREYDYHESDQRRGGDETTNLVCVPT